MLRLPASEGCFLGLSLKIGQGMKNSLLPPLPQILNRFGDGQSEEVDRPGEYLGHLSEESR